MVSRGDDKYVIWPIYFDRSVSRIKGRKVSKKIAIDKPKIDDIEKVAKELDLNPVLEKKSSHPSRFWKSEGRILVDKKNSKSKILRQIANKL